MEFAWRILDQRRKVSRIYLLTLLRWGSFPGAEHAQLMPSEPVSLAAKHDNQDSAVYSIWKELAMQGSQQPRVKSRWDAMSFDTQQYQHDSSESYLSLSCSCDHIGSVLPLTYARV